MSTDEFSCYQIPEEYEADWRQLEPTFYWSNNAVTSSTKNDENKRSEHFKSTSAYALFFRERQLIEKKLSPNTSFGKLSQQIAKQWELLPLSEKKIFKQRCDRNRKKNIARAVEQKALKLLKSSQLFSNTNNTVSN